MYHTYHVRPDEVVIISATRKGKKISLPVSPFKGKMQFLISFLKYDPFMGLGLSTPRDAGTGLKLPVT